jgi:hypothetical protein
MDKKNKADKSKRFDPQNPKKGNQGQGNKKGEVKLPPKGGKK